MAEKDKFEVEIDENEPVFPTSVVARLLGVPVWMLKQLDSAGVVCPPRKAGQARLYSRTHLRVIKKVHYLMEERNVGINGVKVILEIERGEFETP